jgi:hypothetical protein
MPRYYFNVIAPTKTIKDREGTELSSIDEARAEAIEDARQLMGAAMRSGQDISGRRIEITNARGAVLLVVRFSETYTTEI